MYSNQITNKMKTNRLLELYKELLVLFEAKHTFWICNAIKNLWASEEDKAKLKEHFFTQFPSETQYTEIYNEPTFNRRARKNDGTDIWFIFLSDSTIWRSHEINFNLRIKLIKAIINKLENE